MTDKIRKRLGPVSVVATIAVLGLLAAFIALAALPDITSAQGPPPPPPPPSGDGPPPTDRLRVARRRLRRRRVVMARLRRHRLRSSRRLLAACPAAYNDVRARVDGFVDAVTGEPWSIDFVLVVSEAVVASTAQLQPGRNMPPYSIRRSPGTT